jgi:hypothetical protein
MRAVLTGTDFVKDTDGSYKIFETNTNIALQCDVTRYINDSDFKSFISSNGFNEIHLIYTLPNIQLLNDSDFEDLEPNVNIRNTITGDGAPDGAQPNFSTYSVSFHSYLQQYCKEVGITLNESKLEDNSVTIPYIEDSENKLILRLSYDTTSLIDDTYSKDNWEFLKLMNDSNPTLIPKTYISDTELGFDSIGTTIRDNGNHPNYCIKKRITPANNNIYPKLYKISTIEELADIKNNLQIDEYVQEYILNLDDLFENKLSHYRSVDMIYGGELDSLNLWISQNTNISDLCSDPTYDETNKVISWDTPMYKNKYNSTTKDVGLKLSADDNTRVLNVNNEVIFAKDLVIGDVVKTTSISAEGQPENYSASFDTLLNNTIESTTTLTGKETIEYFGPIVSLELENGLIFSDVVHAMLLTKKIEESTSTAVFKQYIDFTIGDSVIIWDNQINKLIETSISNIEYSFDSLNAYILDFETFDTFLTLNESGDNRYGVVTHNYNYDCYMYYCPYYWSFVPQYAYKCSGGGVPNCYYRTVCVKVGGPYTSGVGMFTVFSSTHCNQDYGWACADSGADLYGGGWCNNEKSDIRYKENLKLIGKSKNGLNIYKFNYKNEDGLYEGVIAQELIGTIFENALSKNEDNLYVVDYNKIDVEFKKIK